jgi:nuclear pore complex protein Nup53
VHLQYQTPLQAQRALSKNGKVIGGNIMIGVVPCISRSALATQQQPEVRS